MEFARIVAGAIILLFVVVPITIAIGAVIAQVWRRLRSKEGDDPGN